MECDNIRKQYTNEYAYVDNREIVFYVNGVIKGREIVSDIDLPGYIEKIEEDGWKRGYTKEQFELHESVIEDMMMTLKSLNKTRKEI